MGIFFDITETPKDIVILSKTEWGYWWLERSRKLRESSSSIFSYTLSCALWACEFILVFTLFVLLMRSLTVGGTIAVMAILFTALITIAVAISHISPYRILKNAEKEGHIMSFYYFAPPITIKSLSLSDVEAKTLKKPSEKGYGIPPFWFSSYKIVITKEN